MTIQPYWMASKLYPKVIYMRRPKSELSIELSVSISVFLVGLLSTTSALAQTPGTAGIEGFVTDSGGKPLAGAFVELRTEVRPDGTFATTGVFTDVNGFYV